MIDWESYIQESTEDLIEYIKWKDQHEYKDASKPAFYAFCYRFREELAKKCEIVCKKWNYDKDIALEIVKRTFRRFLKYPNFRFDKSRAKDFDTGVLIYLLGIAQRELINYYNTDKGKYTSPYTGEEQIIKEYPKIDFDKFRPEKRREMQKRFEIIEKALGRLTDKHKIIYLTYQAHEREGYKLPRHLLKKLRDELKLGQATIRYYKFEAINKIEEYLEIYG